MTELYSKSETKSDGDAQTKGSVRVTLTDSGDSEIVTTIRVKKTGFDGNAHGEVYLVCYKIKDDGSKTPTSFAPVSRTVGAKVPQGVNHKNGDASETLFGNLKDKFDGAFLAIRNVDKKAIPRSTGDIIELAKQSANDLFGLAVDTSKLIGDTLYIRL